MSIKKLAIIGCIELAMLISAIASNDILGWLFWSGALLLDAWELYVQIKRKDRGEPDLSGFGKEGE